MSPYIVILLATSTLLALLARMDGTDNSAFVAAMLTIAAIGAKGKV